MKGIAIVILAAACTRSAPPPQPQPQAMRVETEVIEYGQPGVAPAPEIATPRDQPPDIKLKLGHYSSSSRGIGLVIDRTQKEAKIRFDGTDQILRLDPTPGAGDRTDYIKSANHVVMHVWKSGRVVVYVPNSTDGGIEVRRDGDADPL